MLQRLHFEAQWIAIFYLSLVSHTQKTVVTLTQSHTPTTTVSQRTHRPTDKHLCQQTHTPRRGVCVPGEVSSRLDHFALMSLCHLCHVSVLRLHCQGSCACYKEGEILMTNLLIWVIVPTSAMFSFISHHLFWRRALNNVLAFLLISDGYFEHISSKYYFV